MVGLAGEGGRSRRGKPSAVVPSARWQSVTVRKAVVRCREWSYRGASLVRPHRRRKHEGQWVVTAIAAVSTITRASYDG